MPPFIYSSTVYSARVVGAVCNCVMGTTNLRCVNYTTQADSTLTAEVMTMGTCEGATFKNMYTLGMCANLSSALSVNTGRFNSLFVLPTYYLNIELSVPQL